MSTVYPWYVGSYTNTQKVELKEQGYSLQNYGVYR